MRKNRIFAALLSAAIVLCVMPAVFAAENLELNDPVVNLETRMIEISGTVSAAEGGTAALLVLNPGATLESVKTDSAGVQKQDECLIENGVFRFSFRLIQGAKGGEYTVYVGVDSLRLSQKFTLLTEQEEQKAYDSIVSANSASELQKALEENEAAFALDFEPYRQASKKELSILLYKNLQAGGSCANAGELQKLIQQMSVLTCLNESNPFSLIGKDGVFRYADLMRLSKLDEENNCTAYSLFLNSTAVRGREEVYRMLSGRALSSLAEFHQAFAESAVIAALRFNLSSGTGHVKAILEQNAAYLELDMGKYLKNISGQFNTNRKLTDGSYTTKRELQAILNDTASDSGSGSGGISGGGNAGGGSGGVSQGQSGQIQIEGSVGETEAFVPHPPQIFRDLENVSWAKEAIEALYDRGIVSGKEPGVFDPDSEVTREEFVKLLTVAFAFEDNGASVAFSDVGEENWCYPYVMAARSVGMVMGQDDNSFGIGQAITREDAAVMIQRACEIAGKNLEQTGKAMLYTDAELISEYARTAVGELSKAGVLKGMEDGRFAPAASCTRAEAAVMIFRIL